MTAPLTIGVFDSGFGGLTVLRSLLAHIPHARFLYLGDTARLPYGSKSRQTIVRYAESSTRFLLEQGASLLVIACNTASALALPEIRAAASPVPVFGVIEPGASAARAVAPVHPSQVVVLATAATVQSHAYLHALAALGLPAMEKACPLLVPLVEEGWISVPHDSSPARAAVTREVLRIYLAEALAEAPAAETILLGCTHYPLLRSEIAETLVALNRPLHIIDSAEATALAVARYLGLPPTATAPPSGDCTFFATDSVEKFQHLGPHFLGQALPQVHLIDLGG